MTANRPLITALATLVAAGSLAVPASAAPAGPRPAAAAHLKWHRCPPAPAGTVRDPRQVCASIRVPLDYSRPRGKRIRIEISKIPALTATANRRELLVNPGGPADPGLDTPSVFAAELPRSIRDTYDLVGFDPRGVEYSTPQSCGLKDPNLFDYFPYPAANGSIAANVALARSTARACARNHRLKFFTTRNTARDMDRIRRALGVRRISYWGQSYGTYLGTVYASMFPGRVGKMILEGDIGPTPNVWQDTARLWDQGMADRFPDAARVAAANNGSVGFGASVDAVTRTYLRLAAHLDAVPVPLGSGAHLNGVLFRGVTYGLLLHNPDLPLLTQFWKATSDAARGALTSADRSVLEAILGGGGSLAGVPADNTTTVALALICGDASWSHSVDGYRRATVADRFAFPLTAGMPDNVWPCAFWGKPIEPATTVLGHGRRNVMLLQNRRDSATPWAGALRLHAELGRRSVLVAADNGGHYVYRTGSRCVDSAVGTFLRSGRLPARDLYCRDVRTQ